MTNEVLTPEQVAEMAERADAIAEPEWYAYIASGLAQVLRKPLDGPCMASAPEADKIVEYGGTYDKEAGHWNLPEEYAARVRFIAAARTDLPRLLASHEALRRERDLLQTAIESWKEEELVWRQSDHEHRIKHQQMQAGAEELIAELATLKRRLATDKRTAYERRRSEMEACCPFHYGVTFTSYHIDTINGERIYECYYCGKTFPESKGVEADPR